MECGFHQRKINITRENLTGFFTMGFADLVGYSPSTLSMVNPC